MDRKPTIVMSGANYLTQASCCVYAWLREGRWLYVGTSVNGVARMLKHNIIHKATLVLPDDEFLIWHFQDWNEAVAFESQIELEFKPLYSVLLQERGKLTKRNCLVCGEEFKQTRWWQKFCSPECRFGQRTVSPVL